MPDAGPISPMMPDLFLMLGVTSGNAVWIQSLIIAGMILFSMSLWLEIDDV